MAEMKSLSQNSTKSLRLLLADKNRAPLKADSVHVKGYVYTQERNSNIVKVKHEFELNKGVTTGCEIKNDMLYLDDMAENFPVGQFRIYTQTFLPDTMTGKEYITENDQPLFVQVVAKGSFITDRQGAMYDFVFLPIEIGNAAQAPFVPAGADEQWIKDFLKTFVTTPAFKQIVNSEGMADNALSNVPDDDFEKKAKLSNFAQNDLADVDLSKLKEKGNAAGYVHEVGYHVPYWR